MCTTLLRVAKTFPSTLTLLIDFVYLLTLFHALNAPRKMAEFCGCSTWDPIKGSPHCRFPALFCPGACTRIKAIKYRCPTAPSRDSKSQLLFEIGLATEHNHVINGFQPRNPLGRVLGTAPKSAKHQSRPRSSRRPRGNRSGDFRSVI